MSVQERFIPYEIKGEHNKIVVRENGTEQLLSAQQGIAGLEIRIEGNDNLVQVDLPALFIESRIIVKGDHNRVVIGASKHTFREALIVVYDGGSFELGRDAYLNGDFKAFVMGKSGLKVKIGEEFAAAAGCLIRCGDGHTVYDAESGKAINEPEDIILGNHIWVGTRSMILKGSVLADNTVVGAMSLVNKKFVNGGCLIAGLPAREIRRGINWDWRGFDAYQNEML